MFWMQLLKRSIKYGIIYKHVVIKIAFEEDEVLP